MEVTSPMQRFSSVPAAQGMYDPRREHDACGLAMVATLRGTAGHDIIQAALDALRNLEHRGAVGSDAGTGDGAGIVTQIPDAFFRAVAPFSLPAAGSYAVGTAFLPTDDDEREAEKAAIESIAVDEGLTVIGWRTVPTDDSLIGNLAKASMPVFEQLFISSARADDTGESLSGADLDRHGIAVLGDLGGGQGDAARARACTAREGPDRPVKGRAGRLRQHQRSGPPDPERDHLSSCQFHPFAPFSRAGRTAGRISGKARRHRALQVMPAPSGRRAQAPRRRPIARSGTGRDVQGPPLPCCCPSLDRHSDSMQYRYLIF